MTRGRKCDKITELFARETSGAAELKKELTRGRKCDKITELFARETSGAAECTLKIKQRLTRKTLKLI